MSDPTLESRREIAGLAGSALVSLATVVLLLATSPDFGMVWDEGYTVRRVRLLDRWMDVIIAPAEPGLRQAALAKPTLDRFWLFSREEPHGHPPFYAWIGVAGWKLGQSWSPPLEAYRLGPILLTGLTAGVIFRHLSRRKGLLIGFVASALLVLMPRTFAHAHYAHYDMPMTCLWLLTQVAFVASLQSPRWAVGFGMALGLAAGTKFTGWFAVVPPASWVALVETRQSFGERVGLRTLSVGLPIAVLMLYVIQPPWWFEPWSGPARFLASNLSRARTQPLATLYLGRVYDFALPWHNTIVLTAVTSPVLVLALGITGATVCVARRKREPWAMIWPLSWVTLMIIRALPSAPGHDGIRLILPSIASLAILAALGLAWVRERFRETRWRWLAPFLAAVAIGECLVGIARTYPYTDSYYNVAFGGLPGAERSGLELTYYWETAGSELFQWAAGEARGGQVTLAFAMDDTVHNLLREWGKIPHNVRIVDLNSPAVGKPLRPDFFVLQRRRGLYYPSDAWLDRQGHPVFTIRREGVDLLRVYTAAEDREAFERTRRIPVPSHLRR